MSTYIADQLLSYLVAFDVTSVLLALNIGAAAIFVKYGVKVHTSPARDSKLYLDSVSMSPLPQAPQCHKSHYLMKSNFVDGDITVPQYYIVGMSNWLLPKKFFRDFKIVQYYTVTLLYFP